MPFPAKTTKRADNANPPPFHAPMPPMRSASTGGAGQPELLSIFNAPPLICTKLL